MEVIYGQGTRNRKYGNCENFPWQVNKTSYDESEKLQTTVWEKVISSWLQLPSTTPTPSTSSLLGTYFLFETDWSVIPVDPSTYGVPVSSFSTILKRKSVPKKKSKNLGVWTQYWCSQVPKIFIQMAQFKYRRSFVSSSRHTHPLYRCQISLDLSFLLPPEGKRRKGELDLVSKVT